jgi:hypothetical protein
MVEPASRGCVMSERGDLRAAPGSAPWAAAVRLKILSQYHALTDTKNALRDWVQGFRKHEAWLALGFSSWEDFCQGPNPRGLGLQAEVITAEIHRRELLKHGGDRRSPTANQLDNINLKGGTQAAYLRARLQRDAPDVLRQLDRGEFRSVRQAAMAAGILKPIPPLIRAQNAFRRLSVLERQEFRDWLDMGGDALRIDPR